MLTPQEIKDQEFTVKFRGCDPIEVKSYLEELAEEVFELIEGGRQDKDDLAKVQSEFAALKLDRDQLRANLDRIQDDAADTQSKVEEGFRFKDEIIAELSTELSDLKAEKESLGKDLKANNLEVEKYKLDAGNSVNNLLEEQKKNDNLQEQIDSLTTKLGELKKEGLDFKSTILVAQQFADDLKEKAVTETSQLKADVDSEITQLREKAEIETSELTVKTETETNELIANTKAEIEHRLNEAEKKMADFRSGAEAEQDRLQQQLSELATNRDNLKADLISKVNHVLESVEILTKPAGLELKDNSVVENDFTPHFRADDESDLDADLDEVVMSLDLGLGDDEELEFTEIK
ncbi:MAG: DivIVA domain-containing protein [Desulfotalea sp.]